MIVFLVLLLLIVPATATLLGWQQQCVLSQNWLAVGEYWRFFTCQLVCFDGRHLWGDLLATAGLLLMAKQFGHERGVVRVFVVVFLSVPLAVSLFGTHDYFAGPSGVAVAIAAYLAVRYSLKSKTSFSALPLVSICAYLLLSGTKPEISTVAHATGFFVGVLLAIAASIKPLDWISDAVCRHIHNRKGEKVC